MFRGKLLKNTDLKEGIRCLCVILNFLQAFETIFLQKPFASSKGNKGWLTFFFGK